MNAPTSCCLGRCARGNMRQLLHLYHKPDLVMTHLQVAAGCRHSDLLLFIRTARSYHYAGCSELTSVNDHVIRHLSWYLQPARIRHDKGDCNMKCDLWGVAQVRSRDIFGHQQWDPQAVAMRMFLLLCKQKPATIHTSPWQHASVRIGWFETSS